MAVQDPELNRRERKSLQTRRQIVRAAAELVLEEGYERATITRIAERADLAPRTVTTRFPSKEEIFFEGLDEAVARAERHLSGDGGDVVDRLAAWISDMELREQGKPNDPEIRLLRSRAIAQDPDLRALRAQHFDRAYAAIARAASVDTGEAPDAVGPQMLAAATIAMLGVIERLASERSAEVRAELDRGFLVLRATLAAITG